MANESKPSDVDRERLRDRVKSLIEEAGSSQRKIEVECGWTAGTLSRVFGGRKAIDAELVVTLAKALGVQPRALVADTAFAALIGPEPSGDGRTAEPGPDELATAVSAPGRDEIPLSEPAPEAPEEERPAIEAPSAEPLAPVIEAPAEPAAPVIEAPAAPPAPAAAAPGPEPAPAAAAPGPEPAPALAEPDVSPEAAPSEAAPSEAAPSGGFMGFFRSLARLVRGG